MTQNDFLDFKGIVDDKIWETIATSQVSTFSAGPDEDIEISYNYSDNPDKKLLMPHKNECMNIAYRKRIALDKGKIADIRKMIENKWIPHEYIDYYDKIINISVNSPNAEMMQNNLVQEENVNVCENLATVNE